MIQRLYAVYDRVALQYGSPMPARNDAVATRHFVESAARAKEINIMDMSLWFIGELDDETGVITVPKTGPVQVTEAYRPAQDMTEAQ